MPHLARCLAPTALVVLFLAPSLAQGQSKFSGAADVRADVVPAKVKRGQTVTYRFTIAPKNGYHAYPVKPATEQMGFVTSLEPPTPDVLVFVSEAKESPPAQWESEFKPEVGGEVQFSKKPVTWEFTAVVLPNTEPGEKKVRLGRASFLQVCSDNTCVPLGSAEWPVAKFEVTDDEPVPVDPKFEAAVKKALEAAKPKPPGPAPVAPQRGPESLGGGGGAKPQPESAYQPKEPKPAEQVETELRTIELNLIGKPQRDNTNNQGSLGAFVVAAALWGLISLVTPCVFPMIPITVSIFLKHAHGSFRERMKLAGVYCLTIIAVLGTSAFALLKFMAALSVNPITNVLLGALFIVLALSLFGLYELALPGFLVKRLQTKQAQGGTVGTIFGALAFTVISFTCVAPFLGGFAGISAASSTGGSLIAMPTTRDVLGGLAFATAFAAPFFILALVPGLLKALPKSGGWLDSVKVVMGFLELAAALKFFRTAELGVFSPVAYFTFDLVLAGWVGIAFACALYLLNTYRLPHDEEKPNIGVIRLLFALLFFGLGVYLLPGLFKAPDGKPQRPAGAVFAWVDAFLLPEPNRDSDELRWGTDLHDAIAQARAESRKTGQPQPLFVDFTGVTCTNCKYNEISVFTQPKIRELLTKFERVQLYTDWLPTDAYTADPGERARRFEALANQQFQIDAFGTSQLPLYVTLLPTADGKVKVLGVYDEGKINSPDRFAAWLKEALEKAKK